MTETIRAYAERQPENRTCNKPLAALSLAFLVTGVVLLVLATYVCHQHRGLAHASYAWLGVGGLVGLAAAVRYITTVSCHSKVRSVPAPYIPPEPVVIEFAPPPIPPEHRVVFCQLRGHQISGIPFPGEDVQVERKNFITHFHLKKYLPGTCGFTQSITGNQQPDLLIKVSKDIAWQCSYTCIQGHEGISYKLQASMRMIDLVSGDHRQIESQFYMPAYEKMSFSSLEHMATTLVFGGPHVFTTRDLTNSLPNVPLPVDTSLMSIGDLLVQREPTRQDSSCEIWVQQEHSTDGRTTRSLSMRELQNLSDASPNASALMTLTSQWVELTR